jgi:aminoglycoside phosphotransferase (APT) family kinase protein
MTTTTSTPDFDPRAAVQSALPGVPVASVSFEGEGDFFRAYTVNGSLIFRFAWNAEGSRTLEREATLLPALAPTLKLPVPRPTAFARSAVTGLNFIAYPKIEGVELTRERFEGLPAEGRARAIGELAGFLSGLHSFDLAHAEALGVPRSDYPFCRTEEGIMPGTAAEIYGRELARLLTYPSLDDRTRNHARSTVARLLDPARAAILPLALVHGDLSPEHILFNPGDGRLTGVIDFSDACVNTPLLDFVYLRHAYWPEVVSGLLPYYSPSPPGAAASIQEAVEDLYSWYMLVRLLWALDHDWQEGVALRLHEIAAVRFGEKV